MEAQVNCQLCPKLQDLLCLISVTNFNCRIKKGHVHQCAKHFGYTNVQKHSGSYKKCGGISTRAVAGEILQHRRLLPSATENLGDLGPEA